jgi:hypothetical protein
VTRPTRLIDVVPNAVVDEIRQYLVPEWPTDAVARDHSSRRENPRSNMCHCTLNINSRIDLPLLFLDIDPVDGNLHTRWLIKQQGDVDLRSNEGLSRNRQFSAIHSLRSTQRKRKTPFPLLHPPLQSSPQVKNVLVSIKPIAAAIGLNLSPVQPIRRGRRHYRSNKGLPLCLGNKVSR